MSETSILDGLPVGGVSAVSDLHDRGYTRVIADADAIFSCGVEGSVCKLTHDLVLLWRITPPWQAVALAATGDGGCVAMLQSGDVVRFDQDGATLWSVETFAGISSEVISYRGIAVQGGDIYFTAGEAIFKYALADGSEITESPWLGSEVRDFVIDANAGAMYATSAAAVHRLELSDLALTWSQLTANYGPLALWSEYLVAAVINVSQPAVHLLNKASDFSIHRAPTMMSYASDGFAIRAMTVSATSDCVWVVTEQTLAITGNREPHQIIKMELPAFTYISDVVARPTGGLTAMRDITPLDSTEGLEMITSSNPSPMVDGRPRELVVGMVKGHPVRFFLDWEVGKLVPVAFPAITKRYRPAIAGTHFCCADDGSSVFFARLAAQEIAKFDCVTGRFLWVTEPNCTHTLNGQVVMDVHGHCYTLCTTDSHITKYDSDTGEVIWEFDQGSLGTSLFVDTDDRIYMAYNTAVARYNQDGATPALDWTNTGTMEGSMQVLNPGSDVFYLIGGSGTAAMGVRQRNKSNGAHVWNASGFAQLPLRNAFITEPEAVQGTWRSLNGNGHIEVKWATSQGVRTSLISIERTEINYLHGGMDPTQTHVLLVNEVAFEMLLDPVFSEYVFPRTHAAVTHEIPYPSGLAPKILHGQSRRPLRDGDSRYL